jgi:hypothetical protein
MPIDIIRNISGIDTETMRRPPEPAHPERVNQLVGDLQDIAAHDRKGEQKGERGIGPCSGRGSKGRPPETTHAAADSAQRNIASGGWSLSRGHALILWLRRRWQARRGYTAPPAATKQPVRNSPPAASQIGSGSDRLQVHGLGAAGIRLDVEGERWPSFSERMPAASTAVACTTRPCRRLPAR